MASQENLIKITLIILLLFQSNYSISQINDKEVQFNEKKNEVGIDFQNIFSGILGTSIIYKTRIGEKKFISKDEKKALRFRLELRGGIELSSQLPDSITTSLFNRYRSEGFRAAIYTGYEWQKQKNRVQYFYGLETGFEYVYQYDLFSWSWNVVNGFTLVIEDERKITIPLIGFGGVKLFLSKEFSISLESNLKIEYNVVNSNRTIENEKIGLFDELPKISSNEITFRLHYLSMLNLSYYF